VRTEAGTTVSGPGAELLRVALAFEARFAGVRRRRMETGRCQGCDPMGAGPPRAMTVLQRVTCGRRRVPNSLTARGLGRARRPLNLHGDLTWSNGNLKVIHPHGARPVDEADGATCPEPASATPQHGSRRRRPRLDIEGGPTAGSWIGGGTATSISVAMIATKSIGVEGLLGGAGFPGFRGLQSLLHECPCWRRSVALDP
jgi:hypothetical protein